MGSQSVTEESQKNVLKTGILQTTSDSITVTGMVEGVTCQMVVDTGSNKTIVRPDMVKMVERETKIVPCAETLRTVTGDVAPVQGRRELTFQIGSHAAVHDVWVAEITDQCILGLDFLAANDYHINIGGTYLTIGNGEIPLSRPKELKEECRLQENIAVPPRSELIIPGRLDSEMGGVWGTVEPFKDTTQALIVARTVVDLQTSS